MCEQTRIVELATIDSSSFLSVHPRTCEDSKFLDVVLERVAEFVDGRVEDAISERGRARSPGCSRFGRSEEGRSAG